RLTGFVRNQSKAPVAGATVVAVNQINSKETRIQSGADGRYSLRLTEGAYRVLVRGKFVAAFDKNKSYGEFTIARGDTLENVIVSSGKETVLEIAVTERATV